MAAVKKEIFVSYGREEEVQAFVVKLKRDLEKNGFTVWLDMEDIPAGKSTADTDYSIGAVIISFQVVIGMQPLVLVCITVKPL